MSQEEWQMETASKNEEISRETAEFQFVLITIRQIFHDTCAIGALDHFRTIRSWSLWMRTTR